VAAVQRPRCFAIVVQDEGPVYPLRPAAHSRCFVRNIATRMVTSVRAQRWNRVVRHMLHHRQHLLAFFRNVPCMHESSRTISYSPSCVSVLASTRTWTYVLFPSDWWVSPLTSTKSFRHVHPAFSQDICIVRIQVIKTTGILGMLYSRADARYAQSDGFFDRPLTVQQRT
jgi:hypothetical protein